MDLAEEFKLTLPEKLESDDYILIVDEKQDMRMILVHQLQKLHFKNAF